MNKELIAAIVQGAIILLIVLTSFVNRKTLLK